jgi:hypothetical protein
MNRYGFKTTDWQLAKELLIKQGFKCPYTGVPLTPGVNASIDHKNPKSRFPDQRSDWKNVEWVDWKINSMKTFFTKEEFLKRKPPPFRAGVFLSKLVCWGRYPNLKI